MTSSETATEQPGAPEEESNDLPAAPAAPDSEPEQEPAEPEEPAED